jgi:hypothetical protein
MRTLLRQGFSVQTDVEVKADSGPRMILRSFVNALASQTSIDTSKYPLPTNLQVLPSP